MPRYKFNTDPMGDCFCSMDENPQGGYVEYNEKRDLAYKLLLAYAECCAPETNMERIYNIIKEYGVPHTNALRDKALEAAKEAG